MGHFPDDFKPQPMVDCMLALQQTMRENGEERMADFVSLDTM